MTHEAPTLDRVCGNCQHSHPAAPFESDHAICLRDAELEPHLDDILGRQDFSRCQDLVRRKRFAWDHDACEHFDPVDDFPETEMSLELTAELLRQARGGELTKASLERAVLEDAVNRIDWANRPVQEDLRQLAETRSSQARQEVVRRFGLLIGRGNRAAFEGLCHYLRDLPPPLSVPDKELRVEILRQLSFAHEPDWECELVGLLVDDLFRTPSTNTTRGWYTAVLDYFERSCRVAIAAEALERVLESPRFSYRIRRRVREILGQRIGYGASF
jgi:hypothetical protein